MRSYTIELSYAEVIDKELQVMDLAAISHLLVTTVCQFVYLICVKPGALRQVVLGTEEGTTIS